LPPFGYKTRVEAGNKNSVPRTGVANYINEGKSRKDAFMARAKEDAAFSTVPKKLPQVATKIGSDHFPNLGRSEVVRRMMDIIGDRHCKYIYFDVGSNTGIQVRKYYESWRYPKAKLSKHLFDSVADSEVRREESCVFGFELNPKHEGRLKQIEDCYDEIMGWDTVFFQMGASVVSGETVSIYSNPKSTKNDWGANMAMQKKPRDWTEIGGIETVDISEFVLAVVEKFKPLLTIMKLDVEGSEFPIMEKMLENNILCSNVISYVNIEWHWAMDSRFLRKYPGKHKSFVEALRKQQNCKSKPTVLGDWDDESYGMSNFDFPLDCREREGKG